MAIQITAVICTLNRAPYLRKAIRSLVDQTLAPDRYQILVVDNGSTDDTERLVDTEFPSASNLQYLFEPILGLSRARNVGWKRANGEYVAYLDDDGIASPQWLERILDVFETVTPKPGCVGGKIEPLWEAQPPSWLSDWLKNNLGRLDWSDVPIVLSEAQWLGGGNIAFPRRLLEQVGGFREDLGRIGGKLLSNEEIYVRQQLERQGYRCFYHPEIGIQHHVPVFRLTKGWFIRRMYWQGVSNAVVQIHSDSLSSRDRQRVARGQILDLLLSPRSLVDLARPTRDPDRFSRRCVVFGKFGYIAGMLGLSG